MLKTAAIFKDGMILQRNSKVSIWGESDQEFVEVLFCNKKYRVNIVDSYWRVDIETTFTRGNQEMLIAAINHEGAIAERIKIKDILLGEVWLAGGQSNMELELQNSEDSLKVMNEADYDEIRFYNVPKVPSVGEELLKAENNTSWRSVKKDKCADMSAVAFYFARKLYEQLQVPIGIIDCYWGGTSACCWTSKEMLEDVKEAEDYLAEWNKVCQEKTDEEYDCEFNKFNTEFNAWVKKVDEIKAKEPGVEWKIIEEQAGPCPWNPPKGRKSPYRPYGLHNSMIERIIPYGIKGAIYYQAEEDGERASFYSKLNAAVIKQWRKDFERPDLPFYITQLPMFINAGEEDDGNWGILRLQQEKCSIENNAGIAIIADCGEFNNIHPVDKKTPGQRLAQQVLANTYQIGDCYQNMKMGKVSFEGGKVLISFDNLYGGIFIRESDGTRLTAKGESKLLADGIYEKGIIHGFEVKNSDGKWFRPEIEVSLNTMILRGSDDEELTEVKYAMFNYGVANVYSGANLPLMPFTRKKD